MRPVNPERSELLDLERRIKDMREAVLIHFPPRHLKPSQEDVGALSSIETVPIEEPEVFISQHPIFEAEPVLPEPTIGVLPHNFDASPMIEEAPQPNIRPPIPEPREEPEIQMLSAESSALPPRSFWSRLAFWRTDT
jgi:hypothetical protein